MPPFRLPCIGGELFLHQCAIFMTVLKKNYLALGTGYTANRSLTPQLMPSGDKKDDFPYLVRLKHVIQQVFFSFSTTRNSCFGSSNQLFLEGRGSAVWSTNLESSVWNQRPEINTGSLELLGYGPERLASIVLSKRS